jgi:hypothetical protein
MNYKVFKTIQYGGISKDNLVEQLKNKDVCFNKYAETLLDSSYFQVSEDISRVELVKVSLTDLGFEEEPFFADICKTALEKGLSLCPLELGAFLRLKYLEQPEGPYLTIASKTPNDDREYPNGFYVRNYEGKLWLRGYRSDDDYPWPINSEFIFICSTL